MQIRSTLLTFVLLFFSSIVFSKVADPIGYWLLKDEDGRPKTIIRIYPEHDALAATLIEYSPNNSARCTSCTGILANRPFRGLQLITGLKKNDNNHWTGGKILNPITGQYNSVAIDLDNDGNILRIRSHEFVSWFDDDDVWTRHNLE